MLQRDRHGGTLVKLCFRENAHVINLQGETLNRNARETLLLGEKGSAGRITPQGERCKRNVRKTTQSTYQGERH